MSDWIAKNNYLSYSEMQVNAKNVYAGLSGAGWTDNSIYAVLGNMQSESSINPGIWESLKPYRGGYGLVQWTPYTKYSEWAGEGWQNNGNKQIERILWELNNGGQWIPTSKYPMSFRDFTKSSESPELLADVWLRNYERPAVIPQPQRGKQALKWQEFFGETPQPTPPDVPVPPPEPPPTPPEGYTLGIPIWMAFKLKEGYKNV